MNTCDWSKSKKAFILKSNKPNFHIPVAILLYKLVPVVVKCCFCILVSSLHCLLQIDPNDAEALAGQAVQRGPVCDICPLCHWELSTILVGNNSLLSVNLVLKQINALFLCFYFVRMFPENELIADLVSVWKHSIWMLCMGLAVFSISKNFYV